MKSTVMPSVPTPHLSFWFRTGPAPTPKRRSHREAAVIGTNTTPICVPHSPVGVSSPGACLTGRRLPNRKFRQPSCIATMREIHFSIIIPHPLFNLYHFWIYVNDFLSVILHVYTVIKYVFTNFNSEYAHNIPRLNPSNTA